MRKLGCLLTMIGLISLVWLIVSALTQSKASPYVVVGVFVLFLGFTLLKRSDKSETSQSSALPQRKNQKKEHKSWISDHRN